MSEYTSTFSELLRKAPHRLICLLAAAEEESPLFDVLGRSQSSFTRYDPSAIEPGDGKLDRFDALILHVSEAASGSNWFRPQLLRANTRPLLLIGDPASIACRATLHQQADEVLFSPYTPAELLFRLDRLTPGTNPVRHAVTRLVKPCVLIVDDDPDITAYLQCILQRFDVDAHFVNNGRSAVTAARRLLPDLMLLDIEMPVMNGIEVLRSPRSDPGTRALLTVLLTASAEPTHVKQGAELGAVDYILKPFGQISLIGKLRTLLGIHSPAAHEARV